VSGDESFPEKIFMIRIQWLLIALLTTSALGQKSNFVFADSCPGQDISAQIMSCQAQLPTSTGGYKVGTIILPNTSEEPNEAAWKSTVVLGPGVNLQGQGLFASSFQCTVAGDCLRHDASAKSGPNAHSSMPSTVYEGFAITGNSAVGQSIFDFWDAQGVTVRDVSADGANESGGACFWFQDVNWWTERNLFTNVTTMYKCNIGWRFTNRPTNPYEPHPSISYNRFLDIRYATYGAQTAFSFENDVFVSSSTFRVSGNKGGTGSKIIHMEGGAEFYENELHFYGEENGSGGLLLDLTTPKNAFTYSGDIIFPGMRNNIVGGATVTRWMDSQGYFDAVPTSFANPVRLGSSITWNQSYDLGPGTDLNTMTACGYFDGVNLVNGPTMSPSSARLHLQVVCGGKTGSGSVTQIAYQGDHTNGNSMVWQRTEDNGAWGKWQTMPNALSVSTQNLSVGAATWTSGASAPRGRCANGSLYSNTSGAAGSTLFVCVDSQWTDVK
jgi:hypothetical protein